MHEYINGILLPKTNLDIYKKIYEIENWLRRIIYTALMKKNYSDMNSLIPDELLKNLKQRRANISNRKYLDCESYDNIVWLTVFNELIELLKLKSIAWIIEDMTEFNIDKLVPKLEEIIEIRNAMAHNVPSSPFTLKCLTAACLHVDNGISHFIHEYILGNREHYDNFTKENMFPRIFFNRIFEQNIVHDKKKYAISETNHYFSISIDFFEEHGQSYYDIGKILGQFLSIDKFIISFNFEADYNAHLSLNFPKFDDLEIVPNIIDKVLEFGENSFYKLSVRKDFLAQESKYLNHPKVWLIA